MAVNDNPRPGVRSVRDALSALQSGAGSVTSFFLDEISVHHVVLLRVLLGSTMLLKYASLYGTMAAIYGPGSMVEFVAAPDDLGRQLVDVWFQVWLFTVLGAAMYTTGLMPRIGGAAAVLGHIVFHSATTGTAWGDGTMLHAFIFYTLFSPLDARLSIGRCVRCWLGREDAPRETAPAWPVRLVQAHVACMYIRAGWNRIRAGGWLRGRMVFVALSHSLFSRAPTVDWYNFRGVLWCLSWFTFFAELLAPLFLWVRRTRPYWVLALMTLHLGLEVTTTIGWWQYTMIAALTAFLPTRWVDQLVLRIERALGFELSPREIEMLSGGTQGSALATSWSLSDEMANPS